MPGKYSFGFPASESEFEDYLSHLKAFAAATPPVTSGNKLAYDYLYGVFGRAAEKTSALLSSVGIFIAVAFVVFQRHGGTWCLNASIFFFCAAAVALVINLFTVWWKEEPLPLDDKRFERFLCSAARLARARIRTLFIAQVLFAAGLALLLLDLGSTLLT